MRATRTIASVLISFCIANLLHHCDDDPHEQRTCHWCGRRGRGSARIRRGRCGGSELVGPPSRRGRLSSPPFLTPCATSAISRALTTLSTRGFSRGGLEPRPPPLKARPSADP